MNQKYNLCHIKFYCIYCNTKISEIDFASFTCITCDDCNISYRVYEKDGIPYITSWYTSNYYYPVFDFELPKQNNYKAYSPAKIYIYYDNDIIKLSGNYLIDIVLQSPDKIVKNIERIKHFL